MTTKPKTSKPSTANRKPAAKKAAPKASKADTSKAAKPKATKRTGVKAVIKAVADEPKLNFLVRKCPHLPDSLRERKWACLKKGQTMKQAGAAIRRKGLRSAHYLKWLKDSGKVEFV